MVLYKIKTSFVAVYLEHLVRPSPIVALSPAATSLLLLFLISSNFQFWKPEYTLFENRYNIRGWVKKTLNDNVLIF
ncbi:hypothetical protein ROHU_014382 [Labeo rohita]|uniref:Uncharacterized protein n=1 Tax=Labeo rohita TaxID=84645 RepID=A0A498NT84_LABRO|nr:hypothetical protein ROHU_014382 [Labeo rohita]